MKMKGTLIASLCILAAAQITVPTQADVQEHPSDDNAVGAIVMYTGLGPFQLVSARSLGFAGLPRNCGGCETLGRPQRLAPEVMPQPLVPPYSVVKILDQKDTTTYLPSQFANQYGPNGTGTTYLGYIKWYEVVAINPDGTPRTDGQHRIIQGWATASFFVRVSNPFAAAREKKQQDGEKACPPGKQMQVATNLEADPKTGHFAPQLGWKRRIDIIGPTEWPGYINHLCLVRVTDTGAVLMMDATSVMPLN